MSESFGGGNEKEKAALKVPQTVFEDANKKS